MDPATAAIIAATIEIGTQLISSAQALLAQHASGKPVTADDLAALQRGTKDALARSDALTPKS